MARIWQEGFEDGFPHENYVEGNNGINCNYIDTTAFSYAPVRMRLGTGRNSFSLKSLQINSNTATFSKILNPTISELYFRVYFKYGTTTTAAAEIIQFVNTAGNKILSIYQDNTTGTFSIRTRESGSYASRHTFALSTATWYKFDIYLKIGDSGAAYEVKLDNTSIKSDSSLDLDAENIVEVKIGHTSGGANLTSNYDDVALNDTTGAINNSWCGDGTIVGLKPNGVGNSSQWDTSQGYAVAESGTGTTTIKITGHGLSTNDIIYNVTRDAYRIVTVSDADTLTVSSVTSQAQNDIIVAFTNQATIAAESGTNTTFVRVTGHNLESFDVFVNTSRSNAIRRVIYVNGSDLYNVLTGSDYAGSSVSSQTAGDSIKTFKVKQYAISNHYQTCNNAKPNPKYSNIATTTVNDIDLFDMEELVATKSVLSTASIVAVSHGIYAKEKGIGSNMKPVLRSSSTNDEGNTIALTDGTLQYQTIYETSPFTSSAWTISEVDGLEAGVKAI